jgi:hypothetical protein
MDDPTVHRSVGLSRVRELLSVFFALSKYRVVKITSSCSEVVMRTIKHTMFYPGSCHSLEVIALRPVV